MGRDETDVGYVCSISVVFCLIKGTLLYKVSLL